MKKYRHQPTTTNKLQASDLGLALVVAHIELDELNVLKLALNPHTNQGNWCKSTV